MSKHVNMLSIAEASQMTPARISTAFHERYVLRSKAFLEQGKLVYALQQKTLKKGQSIQGIITAKGTPSGSVGNARKAAAIIEALVVSELVPEKLFDKLATFRLVRFANKVLGYDKDTEAVLTPEQLAEIVNQPKVKSGDIADTLECWNEHGKSPADHEADLKAAKEAEEQAEKEAAERAAEIEAADAEHDAEVEAEEIEAPDEAPEIEAEDEPEETEPAADAPETEVEAPEETESTDEEPEVEAEEKPDEKVVSMPANTPAPEGVTAEEILDRLFTIRVDATDLSADDQAAVLTSVKEFAAEIEANLEAMKLAEAS